MAQIFPRWTNYIPHGIAFGGPVAAVAVLFAMWYWMSPEFTDVGYQPTQPVAFSHKLHAGGLDGGGLEIDCRYCHNTVERAARAAVPSTNICMNCHFMVKTDSPEIAKVKESFDNDTPIEWTRVHMLPDYAFFNHSVHLSAGVGCVECHGRIDTMDVVSQQKSLAMGWCLDCHWKFEDKNVLRPSNEVTNMEYDPVAAGYDAKADPDRLHWPDPPTHCSGCHR